MKPASLVSSNALKNLLVILPLMMTSFACKPKDEGKWVPKMSKQTSVAAVPVNLANLSIESLEEADSAASNETAEGSRLEELQKACNFKVAKGQFILPPFTADQTFYESNLVQPYALGKYTVLEKYRAGDNRSTSSDSYTLSVSYVIQSPELKLENRERLLVRLDVKIFENKMSVQQDCTIEYKTH